MFWAAYCVVCRALSICNLRVALLYRFVVAVCVFAWLYCMVVLLHVARCVLAVAFCGSCVCLVACCVVCVCVMRC